MLSIKIFILILIGILLLFFGLVIYLAWVDGAFTEPIFDYTISLCPSEINISEISNG